jgi:hypothetical protein
MMTIKVVGKVAAAQYSITCTDETCRNVIEFDFDDVVNVIRSSMGRDAGSVRGISCPDCNQVLPLSEAELLPKTELPN